LRADDVGVAGRAVGGALRIGQWESGNVGAAEQIDDVGLIVEVPGCAQGQDVAAGEVVIGADVVLVVVQTNGQAAL